jgi:hypothetical protein
MVSLIFSPVLRVKDGHFGITDLLNTQDRFEHIQRYVRFHSVAYQMEHTERTNTVRQLAIQVVKIFECLLWLVEDRVSDRETIVA